MLSVKTEYTIQFVFFSGEEQGLWGSKHYAKKMKEDNKDLLLVVNMDMCGETGFLSNSNTTFIDIDDGSTGIVEENNEMSQLFGQKMEQYAKDYTELDVEFDPIFASDYMPFEARGYVCIGAYDGSAIDENPHYHTQLDVPENLNMPFLTSVTKMVLAFALLESHYKIDS
jgi:Zn-dependent M28 family amino/carboxypeptidase